MLLNISDWLIANKLTLNTSKSNFLIITTRQKKRTQKINLRINNEPIAEKDHVKYLGVLIDQHLSWKPHIQQVNIKVAKSLGIIAKMRHFVPGNILLNIFHAFISPRISYGLLNWGGAYKTILGLLRINLKRAVKLMTFKPWTAHSQPLFKSLKL